MEDEMFPKLKSQAPATRVCVSVVAVAIESSELRESWFHDAKSELACLFFLSEFIWPPCRQFLQRFPFLNILHFLNESAFQRCYKSSLPMEQFVWTVLLVCCYITCTVCLNNASCLLLQYEQWRHYNLSNVLPQLDRCNNYGQVSLLGYN